MVVDPRDIYFALPSFLNSCEPLAVIKKLLLILRRRTSNVVDVAAAAVVVVVVAAVAVVVVVALINHYRTAHPRFPGAAAQTNCCSRYVQ